MQFNAIFESSLLSYKVTTVLVYFIGQASGGHSDCSSLKNICRQLVISPSDLRLIRMLERATCLIVNANN